MMDLRSDPSEIGVGNHRVSLNMSCREQGKLCRAGGWLKLFGESPAGFNNQDLHDQLLNLQAYREVLSTVIDEPSLVVDYAYPYFTGGGSGYGYGNRIPVYSHGESYLYEYCGYYEYVRGGCRESISFLAEVGSEGNARRLLAGTRSRLYELDEASGNWRILLDGLGGFYTNTNETNCQPCSIRLQHAQLLGYTIFTNNFDVPFAYQFGAGPTGCELSSAKPIDDLVALGITRVGAVCEFKGFMIFADIDQDGISYPGRLVWSDFNAPLSILPLPGISLANFADIAFNEKVLRVETLGDYLMVYTDKAIHRGTLVLRQEVSGIVSEVFNFKEIYSGPDALKYKYTLVNTGAAHIFASVNGLYVMTQNDLRPQQIDWIHKAGGAIYNGTNKFIAEFGSLPSEISIALDFGPLNKAQCEQFHGWYDSGNKEVWFSWPSDSNVCPNVSLRLNVQYQSPSLVDHGFTAGCSYQPDSRPSFRQWLINIGACKHEDFKYVKEGPLGAFPESPPTLPLYLWNPTEDPSLPNHINSLCFRLGNLTVADLCGACALGPVHITASAFDFCLKEMRDDVFVREMFTGGFSYEDLPYANFIQSGAEDFGTEVEKAIHKAVLEYGALPQTEPSVVQFAIGFGAQASCPTWRNIGSRQLKCLTDKQRAEHEAKRTRPSVDANFPTLYRGKFLSYRYWTLGTGGGSCYSKLELDVRNAQTRS